MAMTIQAIPARKSFDIELVRDRKQKAHLRQQCQGRIPFFDAEMLEHRSYFVASRDGEVLGLACFTERSARALHALGVGYISTNEAYRNQGVATALTQALFDLAAAEGKAVAMSSYEPDGERWLRPVVRRLAQDAKVRVLEY